MQGARVRRCVGSVANQRSGIVEKLCKIKNMFRWNRRGVGYVRIEDKETRSRSVLDERRLPAVRRRPCSSKCVGKDRPAKHGTSNDDYRNEDKTDSVSEGRREKNESRSGDDMQFFFLHYKQTTTGVRVRSAGSRGAASRPLSPAVTVNPAAGCRIKRVGVPDLDGYLSMEISDSQLGGRVSPHTTAI